MTPKDEAKEEKLGKFWWTVAPYYKSFKPDEDGGTHDIPAIIMHSYEEGYNKAVSDILSKLQGLIIKE